MVEVSSPFSAHSRFYEQVLWTARADVIGRSHNYYIRLLLIDQIDGLGTVEEGKEPEEEEDNDQSVV